MPKIKRVAPPELDTAKVEIPMAVGMGPDDMITRVDFHLSATQGRIYKRIGAGLSQSMAKLRNGRRIGLGQTFTGDILRWMMEQAEDAVNAADAEE